MADLLTLSFRSHARLRDPVSDIGEILAAARQHNAASGVTSLLFYDGRYFLQTLEGEAEALGAAYLRIAHDPRHVDIVPFGISEIEKRVLPDWTIKLIGPNATARLVPDMDELEFTETRLAEILAGAKRVTRRRSA